MHIILVKSYTVLGVCGWQKMTLVQFCGSVLQKTAVFGSILQN